MDETLQNATPAPEATPAPAPAPSPSPSPAPASAPAESFTSIRDHVGRLPGFESVAGRFDNDEGLVNHLLEQYRAAQNAASLAPYAQRYFQHQKDFEEFLSSRAPKQQQPASWWNPPEYNPTWERFVTQDEQGNLALVPGSGLTPDILHKYGAYEAYRRDFVNRFTHDPRILTPMVQEIVQPMLQQALQGSLAHFSERSSAKEFLNGNTKWLYAKDTLGNLARDPRGNLVLTKDGEMFADLVYEAEQLGMQTVAQQQRYAMRILNAMGRGPSAPPEGAPGEQPLSVNEQRKRDFLHRPNPAGAIGLNNASAHPTQEPSTLSLVDRLRQNMRAAGITDESLAAEAV